MPITVKKSGGSYVLAPQGMHHAICVAIHDLGTQHSEKYANSARKVMLTWELVGQAAMDGKPITISKPYTMSLHEKAALRKDLELWRGKAFSAEELDGFDLLKVLGRPCQIQVIHRAYEGKTYANVAAIVQPGKDQSGQKPMSKLLQFSLDEDSPRIPDGTPEWIVDKIKLSPEWRGSASNGSEEDDGSGGNVAEENDDEIPF